MMKKVLYLCLGATLLLVGCKKKNQPTPEPTAREIALEDYQTNYLGSAVAATGWTGNTTNCNAGSLPQTTHDKVLQRINYFRRMVGLNDNTTLDATKFPMYQETALMMKANNALSHTPPSTWTCYTQSGADGAATSNIALGSGATDAVTLFINDPGSSNTAVGHRRWILHSAKTQFSYGSTNSSMALGVIGTAGGNTEIPEFIAYPPKGYIPQTLTFPRWSFGIPGANFTNATVTMTGPSGSVPLTIVSTAGNYGDKTIVWEPQGILTSSTSDVTYTVTVSGITGAPQSSYTYSSIIFKP
ncbi:MAG: CAP domain-containing protein [Flavobacteriales bacterium]